MPMSQPIVYVITGANRGIGFALVNEILKRHGNAIVYAGVRDLSKADALRGLADGAKLRIVELISADVQSNKAFAQVIKEEVGYVDVVIANAGIAKLLGTAIETSPEGALEHFKVNYNGPLVLFQAMYDLLRSCPHTPKFVPITSGAASIAGFTAVPIGFTAYGASKAALNYLVMKIHHENDWLISFPLAPGTVSTTSALENREKEKTGLLAQMQDKLNKTPEDTAIVLLDIVDGATRDETSGKFVNVDSSTLPW